jgi:hypothetical protein
MNSMNRTTTMKTLSITFIAALLAVGCSEFEIKNKTPVASAQVLVNGMPVEDLSEPIPYAGTPLTITLDGNASKDDDGSIIKYLWLRTGISPQERYADAGVPIPQGMLVAPPAYAGDPMPIAAPQVPLEEGEHQYSLWVTDNENEVGGPATLTFSIETPSVYMPDMACLAGYTNTPGCEECVCTPAAMTGCLETYKTCFENADEMFKMLCTAVVNCGLTNGCTGTACYTGPCMAEITAAAAYMGGDVLMGSCGGTTMPATNPCQAASQLSACSNTIEGVAGICANACAD